MQGLSEKDIALVLGLYASRLAGFPVVSPSTLAQAAGWAGVTKDPHDPIYPAELPPQLVDLRMEGGILVNVALNQRGIIVAGMLLAQRTGRAS